MYDCSLLSSSYLTPLQLPADRSVQAPLNSLALNVPQPVSAELYISTACIEHWLTHFFYSNNTQKPDDEFISRFQQTFADIVPRRASEGGHNCADMGHPAMAERYEDRDLRNLGFGADLEHRPMGHDMKMEEQDMKFSAERTPRNLSDLGFTSQWMDPSAMPMMSLAGQHPGFYTPNSGGMGAIYHSQAGDLHTPTLGMNMITPLSLANPMPDPTNQQQPGLDHFNQQYLAQHIPDMNSYVQQASYAPSAFMHRESAFDAMDESVDDSSLNGIPVDQASNVTASTDFSEMSISYAHGEK